MTTLKDSCEKPSYGNWVPAKLIYIPGVIGVCLAGFSLYSVWFLVPAGLFILCAAYFAYARFLFSPRGGNIQSQIISLLLNRIEWDGKGKALDIGCGNGALAIAIATKHPEIHVTGIDYWGATWEYGKSACERNAQLEGVKERAAFERASASALPFTDEIFDLAVSNLVFHEVRDQKDKKALIQEALRVVKRGGRFVFQDLFLLRREFGPVDELLDEIRGWGVQEVKFEDTSRSTFIPWVLKLPFMVGTMGIVYGIKSE
jgi:SAM-dependent methyltransferase